jgi:hypothetical protein
MTFQLPPSVLQSHLAGVSDGTRGAAEHAVG